MKVSFKLNYEECFLVYDNKVFIYINDKNYDGKILPKLRDINEKLNLGIPIKDKNGQSLTTNSLAAKIIKKLAGKGVESKKERINLPVTQNKTINYSSGKTQSDKANYKEQAESI